MAMLVALKVVRFHEIAARIKIGAEWIFSMTSESGEAQ